MDRTKYLDKDFNPPGTIRKVSAKNEVKVLFTTYHKEHIKQETIDIKDLSSIEIKKSNNNWLHCNTTVDYQVLEEIGKKFEIHPLILENIQNTDQRPRLNDTEKFNFIVLKGFSFKDKQLSKNQVCIIFFDNLIITFSENNSFRSVEDRIINGKGKVRQKGCDYLLFSILDNLFDSYYNIIDSLDQELIALENNLLENNTLFDLNYYLKLKNNIDQVKRYINPLSNILNGLIASTRPPIEKTNIIYFKDLINSSNQLSETIAYLSSSIDNILNVSMSISSYKMNGIMKVLTIISTIFIPLTFIAGIYGMNFALMPELKFKWGYPAVLGLMCIVVVVMIRFFKKKKWL